MFEGNILNICIYIITHPYPGGDTEPETLFTHAYDHRRWKIAQIIEKLGFILCFGFNLDELLVEVY